METENIWTNGMTGNTCPKDGSTLYKDGQYDKCPICQDRWEARDISK